MSSIQISKIQLRRGPQIDLPGAGGSSGLDVGEVAFTIDSNRVFVGSDPSMSNLIGLLHTAQQPAAGGFPFTNVELLTEFSPTNQVLFDAAARNISTAFVVSTPMVLTGPNAWATLNIQQVTNFTLPPVQIPFVINAQSNTGQFGSALISYHIIDYNTGMPLRTGRLTVFYQGNAMPPSVTDDASVNPFAGFPTGGLPVDPNMRYGMIGFRAIPISTGLSIQYQIAITGSSLPLPIMYFRVEQPFIGFTEPVSPPSNTVTTTVFDVNSGGSSDLSAVEAEIATLTTEAQIALNTANTAYALALSVTANGVISVAGRTGNVVLTVADVANAAPITSPNLIGVPTAPTANVSDNSNTIATTAFVQTVAADLLSNSVGGTFLPLSGGTLTGPLLGTTMSVTPGVGNIGYTASGSQAVAFDASGATVSRAAFRMALGQAIAFDAANDVTLGLLYGDTTLVLSNGNLITMTVDGQGNQTLAGSLTAPGGVTTLTQPVSDNSANAATTAYVKAAITTAALWTANAVNTVGAQLTVTSGTLAVSHSLQTVGLSFSFAGQPLSGQMYHVPLLFPLTIQAGFSNTAVYVNTNPTSTAVFSLYYLRANTATEIGTISIANTGSVTLTAASTYASASGDVLRMVAPSPQDSTLADIGITISAIRV